MSVLAHQETVRIDMSPNAAIRNYLSGLKPRMHSFEAVWWISCSRFKHCAMVPDSSCCHPAWFSMMTPRPRRGGLAITCKFAHMMGGDVTVTSEPGKSSVLRCACRAARA